MDDAVQQYIDAISPAQRPLFDRVHALVLDVCPQASVTISYQIPAFACGSRRLYVGAWKNWISMYGWGADRDGGFSQRHPGLIAGRGTIKLTPAAAAALPDDELRSLITAALAP